MDYTRDLFQESRDACSALINGASIPLKPTVTESGYFMVVDLKDIDQSVIPSKYFEPGNYEDDDNTMVLQKPFSGEVPFDFAFCRWLAVEKGLSTMPLSNFCLTESDYKIGSMIRVAICKKPETFKDPKLIDAFSKL